MSLRSVTQIGIEEGSHSTMSNSLSEDYLHWLAPQIREEQAAPGKDYWGLLTIMYEKEFVWVVPHDENRIGDGLDLRTEFFNQKNIPMHRRDALGPCSFLEVLIGLSRRLAFAAGGNAPHWAWELVTNLELQRMSDPLSPRKAQRVGDILEACIFRNYTPDGQGGFFPLAWPNEDQTEVELWYQMAAYIDELHPDR